MLQKDYAAVYNQALRYLARREHSQKELHFKLSNKGHDVAIVDVALALLKERKLQSDERYAELIFRTRLQSLNGPIKIKTELSKKGVHLDIITTLFSNNKVDWQHQSLLAFNKQYPMAIIQKSSQKEKAKYMRFLTQRGFLSEHIYALLMD